MKGWRRSVTALGAGILGMLLGGMGPAKAELIHARTGAVAADGMGTLDQGALSAQSFDEGPDTLGGVTFSSASASSAKASTGFSIKAFADVQKEAFAFFSVAHSKADGSWTDRMFVGGAPAFVKVRIRVTGQM